MNQPIEILVGSAGGPSAGSSLWNYPQIAGQSGYLEKSGFGTMPSTTYEILPGGGVQLLGGLVFASNEVFFWHPTGLAYGTSSTSYTNGFNQAKVISALFGRIGWRGSVPRVSPTNQLSKSGRYFQDFHALVTTDNVRAVMEEVDASDADFNAHIESLQKSAILRCLNAAFQEREIYESVLLYDRDENGHRVVNGSNQFVGFEINVPTTANVSVQISSVQLLFDQDVTVRLYLFADGKKTPVWFADVAAIGNEATTVGIANVVLNYLSDTHKGKRFYFGYFQSDLGSAKAIQEDVRWNQTLCFSARSMKAAKVGTSDFDRENVGHTSEAWGLNIEVSAFRDHTNTCIRMAPLFDEAIGLQMAYNVLEQIIYSTRSNARERIIKDEVARVGLQLELNGYAPVSDMAKVVGLAQRIDKEFARMRKQLTSKPKAQTVTLN
jgi:hypothetical protein